MAIAPLAVREVQKVQDVQRKAATADICLNPGQSDCFVTPCCSGLICQNHVCSIGTSGGTVPCNDLLDSQLKFCTSGVGMTGVAVVPCEQITLAVKQYCSPIIPTATPTVYRPTAIPTKSIPTLYIIRISPAPTRKPMATPTVNLSCVNGQTRCVGGRLVFACSNRKWVYQTICRGSCQNGKQTGQSRGPDNRKLGQIQS